MSLVEGCAPSRSVDPAGVDVGPAAGGALDSCTLPADRDGGGRASRAPPDRRPAGEERGRRETLAFAHRRGGRRSVAEASEQTWGWPHLVMDRPAEGAVTAPGTVLSGWAISPAGVATVTVAIDGRTIGNAEMGGARPDVVAVHPQAPGGATSGWRFPLEAWAMGSVPRCAELLVVAEDGNGAKTTLRRQLRFVESGAIHEAGPTLVCDQPAEGEGLSLETAVRGWAFGPAEIAEVEIRLEGRSLGRAVYGRSRPDVAAQFPEWPQAANSGFSFYLPAAPEPPLPREGELVVIAKDAAGRQTEVRRRVELGAPVRSIEGSLDVPPVRAPMDPLRESGWSSPLVVYGWAADSRGVERVDVFIDGEPVAEAEYGLPREDVEYNSPENRRLGIAARSGWQAIVPTDGIAPGPHRLSAVVRGGSGTLPLGPIPVWLRGESARSDPARQARLDAVLRCPICSATLRRDGEGRVCTGGGHAIPANDFGTLLFEETYAGLDWRDAGATSHGYPQEAIAIIHDVGDGLVLDIGAGLRENLPNVIQTDAIAYPTTDVSADAAKLPFADESFDGVIACNLLEHVAAQVEVVQEMRRVCKMGGRLYADCTSVHPYHGFPHHYFNATVTGLDWLMREAGGAAGVATAIDNREAIQLVLDAWLGSLEDPEAREWVEGASVGELLALLHAPDSDPSRFEALGNVFAGGRLLPPKVTFDGVRER